MKQPNPQAEAQRHMTRAQAILMKDRLKREIAQRQEMLRRLEHLEKLSEKHPRNP